MVEEDEEVYDESRVLAIQNQSSREERLQQASQIMRQHKNLDLKKYRKYIGDFAT